MGWGGSQKAHQLKNRGRERERASETHKVTVAGVCLCARSGSGSPSDLRAKVRTSLISRSEVILGKTLGEDGA